MTNGDPLGLLDGGACAYRLPADPGCAALARSLLGGVMTALGLGTELVDAGVLAVSELSTNAYRHGTGPDRCAPHVVPELWAWARAEPVPQLAVSVFDADRVGVPRCGDGALLDEHGRGLAIVEAVSADWGAYLTRSRLAPVPLRGKVTWFSLPLPATWSEGCRAVSPALAAHRLLTELARRGIHGTRASDDKGISVLRFTGAPELNVWVDGTAFSWQARDRRSYARHGLRDVQDATEHLVHTLEQIGADGRGSAGFAGSAECRSTGPVSSESLP